MVSISQILLIDSMATPQIEKITYDRPKRSAAIL
jgi:hypothetical protein